MYRCACGKEYATDAGLKQHRRRYCRHDGTETPPNKCQWCYRIFDTHPGLRQHQRRAHPVEYNNEMEREAEGARTEWSQYEIGKMVSLEVDYDGLHINQFLAGKLDRSLNQIKNHRRRPDYKARVERLRAEREEAVADADEPMAAGPSREPEAEGVLPPPSEWRTEVYGDDTDGGCALGAAAGGPVGGAETSLLEELDAAVSTTRLGRTESSGIQDPPVDVPHNTGDPILEFLSEMELPSDAEISLLRACREGRVLGQRALETYTSRLLGTIKTKPPTSLRKTTVVERRDRAAQYKAHQQLYHSDKSRLAHCVIDGLPVGGPGAYPPVSELEREYRGIFETEGPEDSAHIRGCGDGVQPDLYRPITQDEIARSIKETTSRAAGPDGWRITDIKRLNINSLAVLFNAMIYLGHIPAPFRLNRTILVPKSRESGVNVSDWRPITISSVFLRIINKIWAWRFEDLTTSSLQRGFKKMDGCLANTLTLHQIIRDHRDRAAPHTIISLDLRKAFDTVSHSSILRALRGYGVHAKVIEYVAANYREVTTTISTPEGQTGAIELNRGVKQGDPMSPALFNLVIDEWLRSAPTDIGLSFGGEKIASLAFADDLLLLAGSREDATALLRRCTKFMEGRGLDINPSKCVALTTKRVPSKKKLFAVTSSQFFVRGVPIRQLALDEFRYLGSQYGHDGILNTSLKELPGQLLRINKAPLKPAQKLELITRYLVPRYISKLQNPRINIDVLKNADRLTRMAVRKALHLPKTTSNAYLHAPRKYGGLGLFNFRSRIPAILKTRLDAFEYAECPRLKNISRATVKIRDRLEKLQGDWPGDADRSGRRWAEELQSSYSGNGIDQCSNNNECSTWLSRPPPYWSGEDFIKAVQLRGNLLPTVGIPSNPPENRKCRAGCERVESLSHVLQKCPATHWKRVARHDGAVGVLAKAAEERGWRVEREPNIRCTDGTLKKPDLVLRKGDEVIISDAQVCWEGPRRLTEAYAGKVSYYSTPTFTNAIMRRFPGATITVLPLILGARGAWCEANRGLCAAVPLSKPKQRALINGVIKGAFIIHSHFSKCVWR